MAIYKVRIKTEEDKTTYITNDTKFATISRCEVSGKYEVLTPDWVRLVDTPEEADKVAREFVTNVMASVGVVPNFINEQPLKTK